MKSKKMKVFSLQTEQGQCFYNKSLANLPARDLFLTSSVLGLDRNENSNNFFVFNASEFPGISHFNSPRWLYWYPKYKRDGCLLSQPFFQSRAQLRKGVIFTKVFVLLIPRCSASSLMLPIGTRGVGLLHNTEPLGVTFRSILESKIETQHLRLH